jgi:hypothetical protein
MLKFGETLPRQALTHPTIGQYWPVAGDDTFEVYCGEELGWVPIEREKMKYEQRDVFVVKAIPQGYFAGYDSDMKWIFIDEFTLAQRYTTRAEAMERGHILNTAADPADRARGCIIETVRENVTLTVLNSGLCWEHASGDTEVSKIFSELLQGNVCNPRGYK